MTRHDFPSLVNHQLRGPGFSPGFGRAAVGSGQCGRCGGLAVTADGEFAGVSTEYGCTIGLKVAHATLTHRDQAAHRLCNDGMAHSSRR